MNKDALIRSISTTKGDQGTSQNYSQETLHKTDLLFEALGAMDELTSTLGVAYHYVQDVVIMEIQSTIQTMNSLIATNPVVDQERFSKLKQIQPSDIEWLEHLGNVFLEKKPLEPRFVIPGSETSLGGAYLDLARAICRRAERCVLRFSNQANREDLKLVLVFLNRLSDFLFLFARSFLE